MSETTNDIEIREEAAGLVCISALTRRARRWINRHVEVEPWQHLGDMIVLDDRRLALDLARGMVAAGLKVAA